ncbi:MAG TPA: tetratricopeptide repeat protein, partial [Bryobacteraceae bacterium]|nr:tetratricopeptide repeat protein [Bryobacteraceae bacterium]
LRRAIELNPSYAAAYHWYGLDYLALQGRFAEARKTVRLAVELDPLASIVRESLGYVEFLARQFEEAERAYRELIDFDHLFYKGWTSLGRALYFQGRYEEAIAAFLKGRSLAGELPTLISALAQTYAVAGHPDKAAATLKELEAIAAERYVPWACYAIVQLGFGNQEEALRLLEKACAERELQLAAIAVHPVWDPLRGQPVFENIVRTVGVSNASVDA